MGISTAVDPSAIARVVGIKTTFKDLRAGNVMFLPQRIAVIGQGATAASYSTVKRQVTSAFEAGSLYGFGSPVHLAVMQLLPKNGDGVGTIPVTVYPLDDAVAGTVATGAITPTGTATAAGTIHFRVGGILSKPVSIAVGDVVADIVDAAVAAINAVVESPVLAGDATTSVALTSKWKGSSANDIEVEVVGTVPAGVTIGLTQPAGGGGNPDVQDALDQIGEVWETMVLNCLEAGDDTSLDAYQTFGEGRWNATVRRPLLVFSGSPEPTLATMVALGDTRITDRVNVILTAPGSPDLPLIIAGRQLARIAVLAASNPPHDYCGQIASGVNPGLDSEQWDGVAREAAVQGGISTSTVVGSEVVISDVVTTYRPTGDPAPAYRFVVDVVKLMNFLFNVQLIFAAAEWAGAPLIPDDQPTVNPAAKKPKSAVAAMCALLDNLGLQAIIADPETAKANTYAEIDGSNPKRLNLVTTVQLSGNTNIISVDLNFGFYFGG